VLYDDLTKYEQAAELYESALKIWNASYGVAHPYVANALNNLANVYMVMERYEDAIELHKHSLSVRRSLYGDNHAEVARSLINLGALYVKQSAYDKAEPLYVEAVHVAENLFGPQHPQVAMLLYSLANIYHIQGRLAKAESQHLLKDSVAKTSAHAAQAMETTKVSAKLPSRTKLEKSAQIKFKKAVPLYERALKILDTSMGGEHPAVTAMINELAMLYKSIGDTTNAQKMQARLSSIH
jgi:tetratricopeptide (TPR) repeat protein